ncbi:MAG: hypothetical protein VSS75_031805 [Candidatus Parabeggiatoa sp.]|nr:hypothetical protein [Candidatus Parabeggiatoa sp.]
MSPQDTEHKLKHMLVEAGFDFDIPNPSIAWSVFKKFSSLPVEDVEDAVLWQLGSYDFTGEKLCYLDFVRQFSFYDKGQYDQMEQLHIEFTCTPTVELLTLERNKWAFDYLSLTEYFKDVESFPEFQIALKHHSWVVSVYQGRV